MDDLNPIQRKVQGWERSLDDRLRGRTSESEESATEDAQPSPAGWYNDHDHPGVRRYWDGTGWTDSRVTTEGVAYHVPESRGGGTAGGAISRLFTAVLLIAGGVCVWIAQTYKPTLSNQLGLNGNHHVLTSGGYQAFMVGGIVLLVFGGLRLLLGLRS